MWTRKAKIVAFGAAMAYLIALINDSLVLHAVAGALIGLLGICFLLARRSLRGIDARRVLLTQRRVEGGGLAVRIEITNSDRVRRWRILVEDRVENLTRGNSGASYTFIASHVNPGETTSGRGEYACPVRGRLRLGPLALRGSDPLGIFQARRQVEDEAHAIVYPRTFRFPRALVRGSAFLRLRDLRRTAARGHGLEFCGVREYVPGDDLRHVHWKVTAHVGRVSLKEFEAGAAVSMTLLLDLQESAHRDAEPHSTVDYAVRIAGSAARECVLQGGFVKLVASARRPPVMPTERGDAHLHRILEFLAEAQADGRAPFPQVVRAEAGSIAAGSDVLIITPSRDPALAGVVGALSERGAHVVVVLLDAASFASPARERTRRKPWPARLHSRILARLRLADSPGEAGPPEDDDAGRASCQELAQELGAAGARVAVVRQGDQLDRALAQSLGRRRARPLDADEERRPGPGAARAGAEAVGAERR